MGNYTNQRPVERHAHLKLTTLLVATVGEVLDLLLVRGVIPFRQAQNSPRMLQGGIIASVALSRSRA